MCTWCCKQDNSETIPEIPTPGVRDQAASRQLKLRQGFEKPCARAQQYANSWQLRAAMSLARLLAICCRRNESRTTSAEIHGWFNEGLALADLNEARALLEQLGA
jgi:predicted ATPase